MKLIYIKKKKCPICGCGEIVSEGIETERNQIKIHTNGERWEYRRFLCGRGVVYDPKISMEYEKGQCNNDPKYIAMLKLETKERQEILYFCKENGISEYTINKIKHHLY
ncbi:MAG: hypothetical protein IJE43_22365 [Alphaproteobacteria bacterium]|nr:hypothetical protein [Alphaproteobacteria bacterium]